MRKATLLLIIVLGLILTMSSCGTSSYETNIYDINEEFNDIYIIADTADITFEPSNDGICRVSCYEDTKARHIVEVQDGTLTVKVVDEKKWYDYIGVNFISPKITVYLPKAEYSSLAIEESTGNIEIPKNFEFEAIDISLSTGDVNCYASATADLKITASTGDINVINARVGSIDLTVSTGNISASGITCNGDIGIRTTTGETYLTDIVCKSVTSSGSTGNIFLNNVVAEEKLSIERSTGDIRLDASDAAEIYITTSTGNIEGDLLSEKVFIVRTDTGRIDVPNSITGGRCEITTDTGNIKISMSN